MLILTFDFPFQISEATQSSEPAKEVRQQNKRPKKKEKPAGKVNILLYECKKIILSFHAK